MKTAKKASDKTIRLRCKTLKQLADEYKLTMGTPPRHATLLVFEALST